MPKKEQYLFEEQLILYNKSILDDSNKTQKLTILLAGRPYHSDPLIQHKVSDMVAALGVNVITDDIVRHQDITLNDIHFVSQWAYTNRILKAAKWVALQNNDIQYMQLTSFGCGPDAFFTDEVRSVLKRHGKTSTLLKIDDVSNVGSIKLRVRSLIESLKISLQLHNNKGVASFDTTPIFGTKDKKKKI